SSSCCSRSGSRVPRRTADGPGRRGGHRGLPTAARDRYRRCMTIRLAAIDGRAQLVHDDRALDVARMSDGRFAADPMAALASWDALRRGGAALAPARFPEPVDARRLEAPVPRPAKVFAIGLNYRAHAEEAKLDIPLAPMVFTKFPSCLAGPQASVVLNSG